MQKISLKYSGCYLLYVAAGMNGGNVKFRSECGPGYYHVGNLPADTGVFHQRYVTIYSSSPPLKCTEHSCVPEDVGFPFTQSGL